MIGITSDGKRIEMPWYDYSGELLKSIELDMEEFKNIERVALGGMKDFIRQAMDGNFIYVTTDWATNIKTFHAEWR